MHLKCPGMDEKIISISTQFSVVLDDMQMNKYNIIENIIDISTEFSIGDLLWKESCI